MIKRTIEISREPAHLSTRHRQLVLNRNGAVVATIPCEDLGVVIVDHPQVSYTHAALATLVESDAVVVICGRDHLPLGVLLPIADHTQVVWRIHDQLAAGRALCKRLWQQLVQAKIRAQADNLQDGSAPKRKLLALARVVRSGDHENLESQAARIYWAAWLVCPDRCSNIAIEKFRRLPEGEGANALLNYGYAVVRAAVARALVAAGLLPALGLFHSNRSNAFCLADDLLEPLRPIVDARVRTLVYAGTSELDQPAKAALLELLALDVRLSRQTEITGPLMVMLHRYVASLVKCYQGAEKCLEIPVAASTGSTEPGKCTTDRGTNPEPCPQVKGNACPEPHDSG